ncbi:MAG: hypothetical protein ACK55Z_13315 [bacterium]
MPGTVQAVNNSWRLEVWREAGSYFCPCRLLRGGGWQCLTCG